MAKDILASLRDEIKQRVEAMPSWWQQRNLEEKKYGKANIDISAVEIAEAFRRAPHCDFILIRVIPNILSATAKQVISAMGKESIKNANLLGLQSSGECYFRDPEYLIKLIQLGDESQKIPVVVRWEYNEDWAEERDTKILSDPIQYVELIRKPYIPPTPAPKPSAKKPAKKMVQEKDLEQDLLSWLHAMGVDADNQISTSKHRMDIWIPGKCFIELKRGRVSGDDVCQAIDYCAEYKLPIVIVGNHINEMASRGTEAFNKAVDSEMLTFVQWSAIKTYLKGLISDWK